MTPSLQEREESMKHRKISIDNFEEIICSFALFITIAAIVINIVCGKVTGKRFGQLEELSISAFVWVTFMGVSVAYKHRAHICIDFAVNAMPKGVQQAVNFFVCIVLIVFNIYLVKVAWDLAISATGKTTSLLGLSYFYIDLSVVIGFSCMTVRTVIELVNSVKRLKKNGKED